MINHTSGLPKNLPETAEWENVGDADFAQSSSREAAFLERYTVKDFFRDLRAVTLIEEPGKKFGYSNAAAQLLGLALEHTYGKSYEELVQIKITGPLEMNHTKVKLNAEEIASFPKGYSVSGSFLPALSTRFPAAGSLKSTAADMLKYVAWHLAENDEVVKLTHRPAGNTVWSHDNSFTVGLNWQILNRMGRRTIFQRRQRSEPP